MVGKESGKVGRIAAPFDFEGRMNFCGQVLTR